MLSQGFLLLIVGMGTVYIFLTLMVYVMLAVGKYFIKNESRFRPVVPAAAPRKTTGNNESELIAAAVAAVTAHARK